MRPAWVGLGALAALALVGCRATTTVAIDVARNGAGTVAVSVSLDREAAARAGVLQVGDLERAGWRVTGPVTGADGSVTETVTHAFASPADAARLLGSLAPAPPGGAAPVRLGVTRGRGVATSRLGVGGTVDLRGGVDAFADRRLLDALGTPSLSASLQQLRQAGDTPPALDLRVTVALPGRIRSVAGTGRVEGGRVVWEVPMGSSTTVGASSAVGETVDRRWLEAAGVALAAMAVVLITGWRRARARRHRDRWSVQARHVEGAHRRQRADVPAGDASR